MALTLQGPSTQLADRGNPSLGCSGPGAPSASRSGSECPSGSTVSNDTDLSGHFNTVQVVIIKSLNWSPYSMHVLRAGLHWHKGVHHEHRTPSWLFWTSARHTNLQIHISVKVWRVNIFGIESCILYNAWSAHQQLCHCEIFAAGDASARCVNAYHHPATHSLKRADNRNDWSQKSQTVKNGPLPQKIMTSFLFPSFVNQVFQVKNICKLNFMTLV